jgi:pyridoxine 5-phosphate synthase
MIRRSVNVNKVATLRTSRGGEQPRVLDAVAVCVKAGAPGITVHPRADRRHITPEDVHDIKQFLAREAPSVEFNIEGDPRPDLIALVHDIGPTQCTLVPVAPGEITSQAGWQPRSRDAAELPDIVRALKARGVRVSVFVDAEPGPIGWAASTGADRVELYTEPFARAFAASPERGQQLFETFQQAARQAHALGLEVNAGHDLDLDNLRLFRTLPHLAEVSIGHAIMSRALFVGLDRVVREYLAVLADDDHRQL